MPYLHNLTLAQRDPFVYWGPTLDQHFIHLVPLVLPQVLVNVKAIEIHRISWDQFPPHPTFRFLPTQFPHVVSLTLFHCSFCSLKELFIVLSAFPSLSYLNLSVIQCTNISIHPVLSMHHRMRARLRWLHMLELADGTIDSTLEFLIRCPCLETLRNLTLNEHNIGKETRRRAGGPCGRSTRPQEYVKARCPVQ
ncbi:hypothetical protein B0H21DRAFT_329694 [Amylocystis lapponica]|nr:hypothetical protein B0H21DRAFT_329694 [Amylocystis lapponica]